MIREKNENVLNKLTLRLLFTYVKSKTKMGGNFKRRETGNLTLS